MPGSSPESGRPSRNMLRLGRFPSGIRPLPYSSLVGSVSRCVRLPASPFLGDMSFALRGFGGFPRPRPICFSARRALSLLRKEFFQKMTDFAAIDFETANGRRTSVCSVGVVVVRGGEVVDTFYSLIRPRPNFYSRFTTAIHGLRYEDTADAPDFAEVWRQVAPRIEGLPLVAHNSPFDEGCLHAVFELYGMPYPGYRFVCTCRAARRVFGRSLPDHRLHTVSAACGFDLTHHHHALADAEACARIALKIL